MDKPLFANDKPESGGLFHNKEAVELTGISPSRFRTFQRDALVMIREVYRSQWNLCSRSDLATAVIVDEVFGATGAHHTILSAASRACYFWSEPEQEALPWHPVTHCLYAGANEPQRMWLLQIRALKSDQSGQRRLESYLYPENNPPRLARKPSDEWQPSSDIHVLVTPLVLPLVRRLKDYARRGTRLPLADA